MNNRWFLVFCVASVLKAKAADVNIRDYGAKSDTTQLSTSALQQAIDDCSKAGGGRVVVPAGLLYSKVMFISISNREQHSMAVRIWTIICR